MAQSVSDAANPNGATRGIAGITNAAGNVLGMMPHPERAVEALLGSDGRIAPVRITAGEGWRMSGTVI